MTCQKNAGDTCLLKFWFPKHLDQNKRYKNRNMKATLLSFNYQKNLHREQHVKPLF